MPSVNGNQPVGTSPHLKLPATPAAPAPSAPVAPVPTPGVATDNFVRTVPPPPPIMDGGQPAWTYVSAMADQLKDKLPEGVTMSVISDPKQGGINFSFHGEPAAFLVVNQGGPEGFTYMTGGMAMPNDVSDKLRAVLADAAQGYAFK